MTATPRALACVTFLLLMVGCSKPADAAPGRPVSTYAGTGKKGYSGDGGPGTAAQLNNVFGIVKGPDAAFYICDTDNHVVRRVDKDGKTSTVAGIGGKKGYSGDGGPATKAELNEPYEVRFDAAGDLYIVERLNHVVRKVSMKSGVISTIAGTGKLGYSGDGEVATKATFNQPHSIQFDKAGNLYICDILNHRLRVVDAKTSVVTTFAGTGRKEATTDGGKIAEVSLRGPRAIDLDADGNLWLALREGNQLFKLDFKAGTIHHVAGTGKSGFTGNGGPAKAATLAGPKGVSVGPDGRIYLADTESHSVRVVDPKSGTIDVVCGTGQKGDGPDGDGLKCKLARPHGVFVDADGAVYIGDSENHRVRVVK